MITLADYLLALYRKEASEDEPVYIEDDKEFSGLLEEE